MSTMKPYTVVVGRPDYVVDGPLTEAYIGHIKAPTVEAACAAAKREAVIADMYPDERVRAPEGYILGEMDNYVTVFCCEGHHYNLSEE